MNHFQNGQKTALAEIQNKAKAVGIKVENKEIEKIEAEIITNFLKGNEKPNYIKKNFSFS